MSGYAINDTGCRTMNEDEVVGNTIPSEKQGMLLGSALMISLLSGISLIWYEPSIIVLETVHSIHVPVVLFARLPPSVRLEFPEIH